MSETAQTNKASWRILRYHRPAPWLLSVTVGSVALAPVDQESGILEKFIQRENVTLYKKRLAEPHTDAEHKILLKLLADAEAKDAAPSRGA
jgi:hypothetical protein